MSNELKIHPYALAFPEATAEDTLALKNSIDQHGQRDPIGLLGNEVLDGRTRYQACRELKIPPQFRQYDPVRDGQDPLQWVIAKNLHRRHLTVGQRAALAVSLAEIIRAKRAAQKAEDEKPNATATPVDPGDDNLDEFGFPKGSGGIEPTGDDHPEDLPEFIRKDSAATPSPEEDKRVRNEAAKQAQVSTGSVHMAKELEKHDPERFKSVQSGAVTLNAAHKAYLADKASKQPPLKGTGTIPADTKYRTEAADMMAASLGDEFAAAVRAETILKDGELKAFMKLAIQDQKQIAPLVAKGWKVRQAVKFAKGMFEQDDTLRDLLNLAIMRTGRCAVKLANHTILVIADELIPEPSELQQYIAGILASQAKPETDTPPIDNTVGAALGNAKATKPKALTAKQKKELQARKDAREAFLCSVEEAPKKKRGTMLTQYLADNGREAFMFLTEYPTICPKPQKDIVALLEEITATITP